MKRFFYLLLILFLLIGFSACSPYGVPGETQPTNEQIQSTPPRMLNVFSEAALKTLLNAAQLSDADFTEFVIQATADSAAQIRAGKLPQIYIPSNTEKREIEALAQQIMAIGLPVLKSNVNVEKYDLEYRPDSRSVDIFYDINGIRYRFVSFPYDGKQEPANKLPESTWSIGENDVALYRSEQNWLYGYFYNNDYTVSVKVYSLSNEKTENSINIQSISPIEFGWSNEVGEVE